MKNLDIVKQEQEAFRLKLAETVKAGGADAVAQAFCEFADNLQQKILGEAEEYLQRADTNVLTSRGVRQLTREETAYYEAAIGAMRTANPQQALAELDAVLPKTTIDAVFEDLLDEHPLLNVISFQNTSGLIELIVNTNTRQLASWSPLTAEITKELASGFKKVNMSMNKLSAFMPVAKSMLDLGPVWMDRYVRAILAEALALGLEEAIINGTGKEMPIGMNRQVGEGVTVTGGVYPLKDAVPLNSLDPITYGSLLSSISTTPNGHTRKVDSVLMLVNPSDYLTKIMPATTVRTADGTYRNDVLPFPTQIVQSVEVPVGRAIIGLGKRYFMGIGTAQSGKLEYSDEYKFLEDERTYLVKLYGHGEPLDNHAFVYADITNLQPTGQHVVVDAVKGTVETKAKV